MNIGRNHTSRSLVNPVKHTYKSIVNPVYDTQTSFNSCSDTLSMFSKLSRYIESIKILFYEYSLGNISIVGNILNLKTYETISIELAKLSASSIKYPRYEQLRKNYAYAIAGLYQSLLQNLKINELQNRLNTALDKASILDNPERLKEYIKNFKSTIFPDTSITIIKATIKPQYAEYIKLYGMPSGGVFDLDKLGEIMIRLGLS